MNALQAISLPTNFRRIRLQLAREPQHPEGDAHTGYVLVAPLDREGRLDVEAARAHKHACRVSRFREGLDNQDGFLRRRPGGSWAFHYELESGEDDDPGYRLGEHRFTPGEYVTIEEDEGAHTYRVVSVQTL
jgi:hypothetical protein